MALVEHLAGFTFDDGFGGQFGLMTLIWGMVNIWFGLAVGAKRCHGRDRSGWFQAIIFIPIIGAIWLLVELGFLKGTESDNRFGPDALG